MKYKRIFCAAIIATLLCLTPTHAAYFGQKDFGLDVAKKLVDGTRYIHKFGENLSIENAATYEDIWDGGGTYVPPTVARLHNIISNDADDAGTVLSSGTATGGSVTTLIDTGADFVTDLVAIGDWVLDDTDTELGQVTAVTSLTELAIASSMRSPSDGLDGDGFAASDAYRVVELASTGAPIFHVVGLDATFLPQQEFIVTNGMNNVATANTYIHQFRARVFGASAEGTITSTAQADGTITCQIIDGNNQTLMTPYTIAANETGYITEWWGSISKKTNATINIRLRVGQVGGVGYVTESRSLSSVGKSDFVHVFDPPLVIPGGAGVWLEASSDTNATAVAGGFGLLCIEN